MMMTWLDCIFVDSWVWDALVAASQLWSRGMFLWIVCYIIFL